MTTSNATQSVQKTQSASAGSSAGLPGRSLVTRPPSYVNVPTSVAYAPVPDALVVTMVRILGSAGPTTTAAPRPSPSTGLPGSSIVPAPPCTVISTSSSTSWAGCAASARTAALSSTPSPRHAALCLQNCRATGVSSRAVLDKARHPGPAVLLPRNRPETCQPPHTEDAMVAEPPQPDTGHNCSPGGSADAELLRALAGVGIESPARERIALDPAIEPDWIPAWQLWTQHPARANLSNPAGYIVRRLLSRSRPPEAYLRLARLTPDQMRQLRRSYWTRPRRARPRARPARGPASLPRALPGPDPGVARPCIQLASPSRRRSGNRTMIRPRPLPSLGPGGRPPFPSDPFLSTHGTNGRFLSTGGQKRPYSVVVFFLLLCPMEIQQQQQQNIPRELCKPATVGR